MLSRKRCFKGSHVTWDSLNISKNDLEELEKATFEVVDRHCEVIFSLLSRSKYDLGDVKEVMFQVPCLPALPAFLPCLPSLSALSVYLSAWPALPAYIACFTYLRCMLALSARLAWSNFPIRPA